MQTQLIFDVCFYEVTSSCPILSKRDTQREKSEPYYSSQPTPASIYTRACLLEPRAVARDLWLGLGEAQAWRGDGVVIGAERATSSRSVIVGGRRGEAEVWRGDGVAVLSSSAAGRRGAEAWRRYGVVFVSSSPAARPARRALPADQQVCYLLNKACNFIFVKERNAALAVDVRFLSFSWLLLLHSAFQGVETVRNFF
jgi:hypothetical protein